MLHPFSGNYKATRRPPSYTKGVHLSSSPPTSPPLTPLTTADDDEDVFMDVDEPAPFLLDMADEDEVTSQLFNEEDWEMEETEERTVVPDGYDADVWDKAMSTAFDARQHTIDLSGRGLKSIHPMIADLSHYFALPDVIPEHEAKQAFIRAPSAPTVNFKSGARSMQRSTTVSTLNDNFASGNRRVDQSVSLYLTNNYIDKIPVEVCGIERLAVLSLRANRLTSLPDCIGLLSNLRELNIAQNEISYLPASILKLNLRVLAVRPNPLLPAPNDFPRVKLSPVINHGCPSLKELCIRILVSPRPYPPIQDIALPIQDLAPSLTDSLHLSLAPGHKYHRQKADSNLRPVCCPNLGHVEEDGGDVWFVEPAEERIQWLTDIAGVHMDGAVPVLWKGCSIGCLDFLESEQNRV
ncbi:hypothetical protein CALCODRAFT_557762 [Calocera cornea HHB12733]|uniref:L domain-like protein n=1 Tax=Calocera cornea HHB12733 TaxID=1353952 RepID=A0A165DK71_9BASI|nr:hypothetical protein CALCODRAFT_557762 [Calocera cornea HHB12733]